MSWKLFGQIVLLIIIAAVVLSTTRHITKSCLKGSKGIKCMQREGADMLPSK